MNPFTALGLPADPDLTDEQVRAAWRAIAAATHPTGPMAGMPDGTPPPPSLTLSCAPREDGPRRTPT
ncbi:MAG: hypothetical protein ABSF03_18665 [Streptosporangiaceae bacterium]|jgi:hypothetical protein